MSIYCIEDRSTRHATMGCCGANAKGRYHMQAKMGGLLLRCAGEPSAPARSIAPTRVDRPPEDRAVMAAKVRRKAHPDWRDPSRHTRDLAHDNLAWEYRRPNCVDAKTARWLPVLRTQSRRLAHRIDVIDTTHGPQAAASESLRSGRSLRVRCLTCEFRRVVQVLGRPRWASANRRRIAFGAMPLKESIDEWLQHWDTEVPGRS